MTNLGLRRDMIFDEDGQPVPAWEYRCAQCVKEHKAEGWQFVLAAPVKPGRGWRGEGLDEDPPTTPKTQAAPPLWREIIGNPQLNITSSGCEGQRGPQSDTRPATQPPLTTL